MNHLEIIIKKMSEDYVYAAKVLTNPMAVNDDSTDIEAQSHDFEATKEMADFLDTEYQQKDPGWARDTLVFVNDTSIDDDVQLVYFNRFTPSSSGYPYICIADGATSKTSDVCVAWNNAWLYDEYINRATHIRGNIWKINKGV